MANTHARSSVMRGAGPGRLIQWLRPLYQRPARPSTPALAAVTPIIRAVVALAGRPDLPVDQRAYCLDLIGAVALDQRRQILATVQRKATGGDVL
jgi:hypothetical protein